MATGELHPDYEGLTDEELEELEAASHMKSGEDATAHARRAADLAEKAKAVAAGRRVAAAEAAAAEQAATGHEAGAPAEREGEDG